jgi:hypothetical protein
MGLDVPRLLLHIDLYDSVGKLFRWKSYDRVQYASQFIDQIFPGLPDGFLGYVHIYNTWPPPGLRIGLTVLRMETNADGSFLFTSVPVTK